MGKKSRIKRERRAANQKSEAFMNTQGHKFSDACNQLSILFSKYSASDIIVSLCVSDLWIPNISSQVKHLLAFTIATSINAKCFTNSLRINSFKDFNLFIKQVYKILPEFPMLEDYIPETDWGEVKYALNDDFFKIFYGGSIERIPDFIAAFFLLHEDNNKAQQDMHTSILMQNYVLTRINKNIVGDASNIKLGHIEIPTESFWKECREVIISLSGNSAFPAVTESLIIDSGMGNVPLNESEFSNDVLMGKALPYILAHTNGQYFPLSLRNTPAVTIDFWSKLQKKPPVKSISEFVASRFPKVVGKPFKFATRAGLYPQNFSALILSSNSPILILVINELDLQKLPEVESAIKKILTIDDWWLRTEDGKSRRILSNDGSLPKQLSILAVVSVNSTTTGFLTPPSTNIRIFPLADFVTLFDSIKDADELNRYWRFLDNQQSITSRIAGAIDQLAAFRDADGVLIEGAVNPTMLVIDPHWGSSWRYQELSKYWANIPSSFPEVNFNTTWKSNKESSQASLFRLESRSIPVLSWSINLQNSTVHFTLEIHHQLNYIRAEDGHILELMIHCLADSLNQCQSFINTSSIFPYKRITIRCQANLESLISLGKTDKSDDPLFSNWTFNKNLSKQHINAIVDINLQNVHKNLSKATDASFEVFAIRKLIEDFSCQLNISYDKKMLDILNETSNRPQRFTLTTEDRKIDVPDYFDAKLPRSEHYKIARRELAIIFKEIGTAKGTYELQDAKIIIDQARDHFRQLVHNQISQFEKSELIQFCVEQIDQLTAQYDQKFRRTQISLSHEVDYNRSRELAEAHENFITNSRNYRYLLEACISMAETGSIKENTESILQLVAYVDWQMVLYSVGDVLHNGLDVAGIIINDEFVPEIFYQNMNGENQEKFSEEASTNKLGIGLKEEDEVKAIQEDRHEWHKFNLAFKQDTKISLDNFHSAFIVLYRWCSYSKEEEFNFFYRATKNKVCNILVDSIKGLTQEEAELIIDFLTLESKGIRRLIGKDVEESDVPLWEHNKRNNRYAIKPLIKDNHENLLWGAAMMERAARIWMQNFRNGYMPADFYWPNVIKALEEIKKSLERQLEKNTESILLRATPYVLGGVDFMRRFPKERFPDVGDFDGLAYWPEINTWVTAECKYNQPAFCLKDGRRLRDRIFDVKSKKAHMPKIQKRREFLNERMNKILELLKWPSPTKDLKLVVHELYISRDIYWWMRNPPYSVPTQFIRIDALDNWLVEQNLLLKS